MPVERINLTEPIETRDGTLGKDSRTVNAVFEKNGQHWDFVKRPGLAYKLQVTPDTPPGVVSAQGLMSFGTSMLAFIANTVYKIDGTTFAVSTVGSTSVSTSNTYFVRTLLDASVFFHNKVNAYTYTSGGVFSQVTNDKVSNVIVNLGGSNYSAGITLTFSAGGVVATSTVDVSSGTITSVAITNPGSGLSVAPIITIVQPSNATPTGTGTSGQFTVNVSSAAGIYTGMAVVGTGIGTSAKVTSISGLVLTLSVVNSGAVSGTITFSDAGAGAYLTTTLSLFPSGPYVAGTVFLDNFIFIATAVDNRIYSSNIGDPTTWNPLAYIVFNQTNDTLIGIAKHLNYLVAFGKTSMQFFYDAGTGTSTVTPLGVAESYTLETGCASPDSIVSTDNTVLWVGTTKTHGRSVYLLDGVSPIKVSTASIDKCLEADGLTKVSSYAYKFWGHSLYILTLHTSNITLVYDLNEKMWTQWTQWAMASSDQPSPGTFVESYFRGTFYAECNSVPYVLDDDTSVLYYFSNTAYQDNGQSIYCRTVTDNSDNGSTHRKFYGRLEIVGDKTPGGVLQVRHSGDDYNTWSNYRSIDLNASRAQIYLGGADRRRAWDMLCTSNVPLRLECAEIDFRVGEMDQSQGQGTGG